MYYIFVQLAPHKLANRELEAFLSPLCLATFFTCTHTTERTPPKAVLNPARVRKGTRGEFTCHKRRPLPFPPKMRAGETESHRRLDDDLVNLPTCDNGLDLSKRFIEFDIPIDNAEERTIADPS